MAVNSDMDELNVRHVVTSAISLPKIVYGFLSLLAQIGVKAKSILKNIQMARMLSVLSRMSDYQLAQIGIPRSDIAKYAEALMVDE